MRFQATLLLSLLILVNSEQIYESKQNLQEIYDAATAWTKAPSSFLGDGCYTQWMDFTNYQSHSDLFDYQTTDRRQNPASDGWWLHSSGTGSDGWSRMRFKGYTFNSFPQAKTHISVIMRGAPDAGKNSNAYLIQTKGKYDLNAAVQDGTKDEIDFSEYYGNYRQTYCVYKSGHTVGGFPGTYPISDAGNRFYKYEIVLDNGSRSLDIFLSIDGQPLLDHRHLSGSDVPNQPMELFVGMWDCSGNGWCPGKYNGVSGMVVQSIWVQGC